MIGTYYRLSLADEDVGADKAESNSIQGQRGLVEYSSFRCCWKQMAWRQEKTISLKDGMMPRKMQLSFRLKKMNKVPSRLKSVQLDITSIWSYNTSKWT